jgi:hypothetical protein
VGQTRLPNDVEDFVERHLSAAAQAEALILLHREREKSWTAASVSEELRIDAEHAEQLLAPLAADGLLVRKGDRYRYGPRTARLTAAADAFVAAYPTYRVAIISLIFAKPRPSVRNFSDAFRLRSEDDDG